MLNAQNKRIDKLVAKEFINVELKVINIFAHSLKMKNVL